MAENETGSASPQVQTQVDQFVATASESLARLHTLVEQQASRVAHHLRTHKDEQYKQRRDELLRLWHNRASRVYTFWLPLAVVFAAFIFLSRRVEPGALAFFTRLTMFASASVIGLVLLWGAAFNELRPEDKVHPWQRLRLRGKVLVLISLLALLCTGWTLFVDQITQREARKVFQDKLKETADAAAAATKKLDELKGKLPGLEERITAVSELLKKMQADTSLIGRINESTESLSTIKNHTARIGTMTTAGETLASGLRDVKSTVGTIKTATDNVAAIKTATDNITAIKTATDNIGAIKTATDNITTIKTATDNITAIKTATDNITAIKTATDNITAIKAATDNLAAIKSATDNIAAIKNTTDAVKAATQRIEDYVAALKKSSDETAKLRNELKALKQAVDGMRDAAVPPAPQPATATNKPIDGDQ